MSDLIQLGIGERPWLPTPNTKSIEVFDRYDMPITGLLMQADALFVFDCIEGHVMEGNVWVYAYVSAVEATALRDAEGDEFARLLDEAFAGRPVMAALAIDARLRSGTLVDASAIKEKGLEKAVLDELKKGIDVAGNAKNAMNQLVNC